MATILLAGGAKGKRYSCRTRHSFPPGRGGAEGYARLIRIVNELLRIQRVAVSCWARRPTQRRAIEEDFSRDRL